MYNHFTIPEKVLGDNITQSPHRPEDDSSAAKIADVEDEFNRHQKIAASDFFGAFDPAGPADASQPLLTPRHKNIGFNVPQKSTCEEGHEPKQQKKNSKSLIFDYGLDPASPCSHHDKNKFLSWNSEKSLYCCQPKPDDDDVIMRKLKDKIQHTFGNIMVNPMTRLSILPLLHNYIRVYEQSHTPEEINAEKRRVDRLFRSVQTPQSSRYEPYDPKSRRVERANKINPLVANILWNDLPKHTLKTLNIHELTELAALFGVPSDLLRSSMEQAIITKMEQAITTKMKQAGGKVKRRTVKRRTVKRHTTRMSRNRISNKNITPLNPKP